MRAFLGFPILAATSYALNAHGITGNAKTFAANKFDFVVVGGGTAGLVVANRLTENAQLTVGVIDAGHLVQNDPLIDVPLNVGIVLGNTTYDWAFATPPQPGMLNRSIPQPRGKILGGSSGINYMVYDRASKPEYDAWAELGSSGWDWNNLLPFFKKQETVKPGPSGIFNVSKPQGEDSAQGKSGPLQVGYTSFYSDLFNPFVRTFTSLFNVKINLEPEGGDATGLFNCQRSVDNKTGARSYATTAYLLPATSRKNLLVLTGAQATKVLLSKPQASGTASLTATGVDFVSNNQKFTVHATREVILSTGSYKTPQLLELSGIGGKMLLDKLHIPVLRDMPQVGENLQDHTLLAANYLLKDPAPLTYDELSNNATFRDEQSAEYAVNHTGILASTNPGITFNPVDKFVTAKEKADMVAQLEKELAAINPTPIQQKQYTIQRRFIAEGKIGQLEILFGPGFGGTIGNTTAIPGRSYMSFGLIGLHPFSRGSVHINSSVGTAAPVIDPKYFSFSWDRQIMDIGVQSTRRIAATQPLASFVDRPFIPPPSISNSGDIDLFVRNFTISTYHPVGTAALAPESLGGVVDPNLLVYGTSNLRIVDASIIPMLIATHTQASVYAVAEKGADIIKRIHPQ